MYLVGVAFAGLFLVLTFFTKLSSVPPILKATILGVRIILGVTILGMSIFYGIEYYNKLKKDRIAEEERKELFEKVKVFSPVGSWGFDKSKVIDFYSDSTFSEVTNMFNLHENGTYSYYLKNEEGFIQLNYPKNTTILRITGIDGNEVWLHELDAYNGNRKMIKR